MIKNQYFKMFANCIPVKGYSRSVIYDLQRNNYEFIPNSLFDILNYCDDYSIEQIIEENKENESIITNYFQFLIENEFGFICSEKDLKSFPKLNTEYHHPSIITNAILDFDSTSCYNINKVSRELDYLGCKALQIRFFDATTINEVKKILNKFNDSRIRHIDLIIPYSNELDNLQIWQKVLNEYSRVIFVVLYNAPENKTMSFEDIFTHVHFTSDDFSSEQCCGKISQNYFSINFDMYLESLNFNSCLNRKISVDRNGNIKNCPSLKDGFGNISQISLYDAVKHSSFKQLWTISKDQINVCKDCEFRYMCTDCRAYVGEEVENKYAKPAKCKYDPYTATWES